MGKNLFDFGNENVNNYKKQEENNAKKIKSDQAEKSSYKTQEQAKNIYEKYKDLSQEELVNEFLNTSKQKINEGSLSKTKIEQTANLLSPYLNEQQKQFLTSLMDKL